MKKVIREGKPKGTHSCPNCGQVVSIQKSFGDPPKCGCGTYYRPTPPHTKFH